MERDKSVRDQFVRNFEEAMKRDLEKQKKEYESMKSLLDILLIALDGKI